MLDSLAFFAFCCEILIIFNLKNMKTCSIYPCFARFKTCVVECSTVLFGVAFVKMLKNTIEKKTAFPLVLWGLKIHALSTGTGHLSGRRHAYVARGQRGKPA